MLIFVKGICHATFEIEIDQCEIENTLFDQILLGLKRGNKL